MTQPAKAAATIDLATNAKIGQNVLVDAKGMTLYLFVPDGTSPLTKVPTEFQPNWPPEVTTGAPVAGTGVDMTKLGVQTQTDGTNQVTYNGHLLYTFVNDTAPGDTNGQGLGPNNWYVLDANGNPIKTAAKTSTPPTSGHSMSPNNGGW
jgi:predicted lipoprotein with Yx(FWY)xxD motif